MNLMVIALIDHIPALPEILLLIGACAIMIADLYVKHEGRRATFIAAMITMNSPTKPLVAGRPEFAMTKSIMKEANFGMVLTTPP